MTNTIDYYDKNVEKFISDTLDVDMSELYNKFLINIPHRGHILDAGCGSGRDSKYFLEQGHYVTAMDASKEMVATASKLTGLDVHHQKFSEISYKKEFDGIWACASVLHVPKADMISTINILRRALKDQGILYLSYKYGLGEEVRKKRHFSNYTEKTFNELLEKCAHFEVLEMWTTSDARPYRKDEMWLNLLLQRN